MDNCIIEPPAGVIVLGVDTPKRKSCEYPKSETAREWLETTESYGYLNGSILIKY